MNIKPTLCKLLLLFVLLPSAAFALAPVTFSNIFVFGDSLSDTGNLAALPNYSYLNNPPYQHGYTNGAPAVEVLASTLGLTVQPSLHLVGNATGTNYAVAGARARDGSTGNIDISLSSQVNIFLEKNGTAPSDALYIVFIGGNDVADAFTTKGPVINNAVKAIDTNIRNLINHGAKAIMVVNVPDLGLTPKARFFGPRVTKLATAKSKEFNKKLLTKITRIEKDLSIDLVVFDFLQFHDLVNENTTALGYTNSKDACLTDGNPVTYSPSCENGAKIDDFIYFDAFHPTRVVHERVGRALHAIVPVLH